MAAEIQTKLIACTLGSEAQALLEAMPAAQQLMPPVSVDEVQKQLGSVVVDEENEED